MVRHILSILIFLFVAASAVADTPYEGNADKSQTGTDNPYIRIGNIPDQSVNTNAMIPLGAPSAYVATYFLDAPPAQDLDYFMNDVAMTTARDISASILNNGVPPVNEARGVPYAINYVFTASGATTGTIEIIFKDFQQQRYTRTLTWINETTETTAFTGVDLESVEITAGFSGSRTLDIGFGTVFGLPYPMYAATHLHTFVDADGADFPADADNATYVAGVIDSTTADHLGTVDFADNPDGTSDYFLQYTATFWNTPDANPNYGITSWADLR